MWVLGGAVDSRVDTGVCGHLTLDSQTNMWLFHVISVPLPKPLTKVWSLSK